MKGQAVPSGTGIGIRKDGPLKAQIGDTIEYIITVCNLGDFWIRNITVTDTFPNGTSASWDVSDLASLGRPVDSYTISGLLYTISDGDVPQIINYAEVTGYSEIEGLNLLVRAETSYPTFVVKPPPPPVGGYSVSIITAAPSTIHTVYIILLSIMTATFTILRYNTSEKNKNKNDRGPR